LLALLGPSGFGQDHAAAVIAGLDWPDTGEVTIDGEDALGHGASERHVGFVFQHYALFRHMTVFENVAFGLRVQPRAIRKTKPPSAPASRMADLAATDWAGEPLSKPVVRRQPSAHCVGAGVGDRAAHPLLDEPFGALDAKVRKELRQWLRCCIPKSTSPRFRHPRPGRSARSRQRVVVMTRPIEQIGTPGEVYDHPATAFVHGFIGEFHRTAVEVAAARCGSRPAANIAADGAASGAQNCSPPPRHADRAAGNRLAGGLGAPCPLLRPIHGRRSPAAHRSLIRLAAARRRPPPLDRAEGRTWRTSPPASRFPAGRSACRARTNSLRPGSRAIGGDIKRPAAEPHRAAGNLHRQYDGSAVKPWTKAVRRMS